MDGIAPDRAMVPLRQETVNFYGDPVLAAQVADGTVYVPLRPLCDQLGLAWTAQRARLNRHPILRQVQGVIIRITPGGRQPTTAIPLKYLPGWLAEITVSKVKPGLQARILRYQYECYDVLWQHFRGEILPPALPEATVGLTAAEVALEQARALVRLAEQQVALEQRLDAVQNKQEVMAGWLRGQHTTLRQWQQHAEARLSALEIHLGSDPTINEVQATELALAVKAVAAALDLQPVSGATASRNGYQRVYAELYRRYGINSYKNLPATRIQDALDWLHAWYTEIGEIAAP